VTDAGLLLLALPPPPPGGPPAPPPLHAHLTSLAISHTAATDGAVGELVARCAALRSLALRGLLYSADATVARVAAACRHLTALDLRHCSTLSGARCAALFCFILFCFVSFHFIVFISWGAVGSFC
jgi:hypothetical protein